MGMLEVHKAMLMETTTPVTLKTLLDSLSTVLVRNCGDALAARASDQTVTCSSVPLPEHSAATMSTLYHSSNPCESGVEGVLCGGFENTYIFYQMKLRTDTTPSEVRLWLQAAHARARELGYKSDGKEHCLVFLFVTGVVEENLKKDMHTWPDNSVVVPSSALQRLLKPFGAGFLTLMVEYRSRLLGAPPGKKLV